MAATVRARYVGRWGGAERAVRGLIAGLLALPGFLFLVADSLAPLGNHRGAAAKD